MKNKLLITTALIAVFKLNNVYATQTLPDLNVTDRQEITESTGVSYNTIIVAKNAELTLNGANIKTSAKENPSNDIVINGTLNLKNESVLEAGSDTEYLTNNSNVLFDGATVNMTDSDLEANGNIVIKNTNLTVSSSSKAPNNYGVWAEGNIGMENGTVNIGKNAYMNSSGDIIINGGELNMTNAEINSWDGSLNVNNGTITLAGDASAETNLYARKELNINGGVINMSGDDTIINNIADYKPDAYPAYDLNINNGTINVTGQHAEISSSKSVNINGGTINIADGSTLGIYGGNEQEALVTQFAQNSMLNISGVLDTSLNGNGTVNFNKNGAKITGSVNLTEGGVMNVGLNNAVVEGDATFNSGSTLKIEVGETGNGSLQAASITGKEGSKLSLNITKQMEIGDKIENVELLIGNVDNKFTKEISNNRYKVTSDDGKHFTIVYEHSASDVVIDAGGSVNNVSVAEAWDKMSTASGSSTAKEVALKLEDLSENNVSSYVDALTAVAPEVAPMLQQTQSETANQIFGAIGTRLSGGAVSAGGQGMSSGDNIFDKAAFWGQALFNKSKLDDTSKSKGFDADSNGMAMGMEKYLNNDTKVGVGYAYTNTNIDGFMRSTDVDTHTAFVYGEYKPSAWYMNGIVSYGWSNYSENKNVSGIAVNADYDAETLGLQIMTGYDMQIKNFALTPEVGLRYVRISQDGYTDSASQKISGSDSDIFTGVIGAKASKNFELTNGWKLKPEVRVAATYDIMNDDVKSVVTLSGGSAYTVTGEALDRFGMEFGAGITAEVNDYVELSLSYEGKFRKDYQDHTGLLNAKYNF